MQVSKYGLVYRQLKYKEVGMDLYTDTYESYR